LLGAMGFCAKACIAQFQPMACPVTLRNGAPERMPSKSFA
jgi:hypothetical protein